MTELLLKRGIDPGTRNKIGKSILQRTLAMWMAPNPEIVRMVRERLETFNERDEEGKK